MNKTKLTFRPMPVEKPKVYLVPSNSLGAVYGAAIGLSHLNSKTDLPYRFSMAVYNTFQQCLVNSLPWVTTKAELITNVQLKSSLVSVDPDPDEILSYIREDLKRDQEIQAEKNKSIDPERFKLLEFPYSSVMFTLREVLSALNMSTLSRPMDLISLSQHLPTFSEELYIDPCVDLLGNKNYLGKSFRLIERGFAECDEPDRFFPNTIVLPTQKEFENLSLREQLGYVGLFTDPNCTAIGVTSSFWVPIAISFNKENPFIVWDLSSEDLDAQAMAYHLPITLGSVVINNHTNPNALDDLVFSINSYHKTNSNKVERGILYKPLRPEGHVENKEWIIA